MQAQVIPRLARALQRIARKLHILVSSWLDIDSDKSSCQHHVVETAAAHLAYGAPWLDTSIKIINKMQEVLNSELSGLRGKNLELRKQLERASKVCWASKVFCDTSMLIQLVLISYGKPRRISPGLSQQREQRVRFGRQNSS